jgi:hypothetical protein
LRGCGTGTRQAWRPHENSLNRSRRYLHLPRLIIGAVYGINVGQPMLWLLRGFGAGAMLALLVWAIDRHRS